MMNTKNQFHFIHLALLLLLSLSFKTHAQLDTLSLKDLSLDDLANLDVIVTSATKKSQKLSNTAAAIFVISQQDIRNSGVTTIPDALRMAPGIQVARIDVNKWSVTARGFSGRFANKLLVMIDGRTIYNPLFSGVYWDTQNAQLENIERIEIIRGPGAAIWGANAVNGVINIITKNAQQTQGTTISVDVGSKVKRGLIRYGGKLGDTAQYRLYANYHNHDDSIDMEGGDTSDNFDLGQGGVRLDWQMNKNNNLTIQGDYYEGSSGHTNTQALSLTAPFTTIKDVRLQHRGANFISLWNHRVSKDNQLKLKFYYDLVKRQNTGFKQSYETYDFEMDQQFKVNQWHEINWGIGYRLIADEIIGTEELILTPKERTTHLISGFIQEELTLIPEQLTSIFAIRLEHNDYSGFEFQPTARILWTPTTQHSFWAAFSRAVRTPARTQEIRIDQRIIQGTPPGLVSIFGNPDSNSEEVFAYEAGFKFKFSNQLSFDLSAFYNIYDEIRTFEQGTPRIETSPAPAHRLIPINIDNKMEGESYGIEVSSSWQVFDSLKLNAAYTYTKLNLHTKHNSLDTTSTSAEGETPQQQFSLRSDIQFFPTWSTHLWLRYVDSLPAQDIKPYITLDARIAWQAHTQLELSVVGQNLLDSYHPEYSPEILSISPSQVERSILGQFTWHF